MRGNTTIRTIGPGCRLRSIRAYSPVGQRASSTLREMLLTRRGLRRLPCTNRRTRQTEVLPQRHPRIVPLIETPPLQLRDHVGDEIRIGAGHMGRSHNEAVARAAYEHVLHRVGDLLWTADESALN